MQCSNVSLLLSRGVCGGDHTVLIVRGRVGLQAVVVREAIHGRLGVVRRGGPSCATSRGRTVLPVPLGGRGGGRSPVGLLCAIPRLLSLLLLRVTLEVQQLLLELAHALLVLAALTIGA